MLKLVIILSLVALSTSCGSQESHSARRLRRPVSPRFPSTKININKFAVDFYNKISEKDTGNLVFSPFSIHTALSMALEGSPSQSNTYKQLSKTIYGPAHQPSSHWSGMQKVQYGYSDPLFVKNATIKLANKAFIDDSFQMKDQYNEILKTFYNSSVQSVDYAHSKEAADTINAFVDTVTNGMIKELVNENSFDDLTRMTLINAIYFKDNWKFQFNEHRTRPMAFNGQLYPYGMNMKADLRWADMKSHGLDAEILELPYENENFRMLLVLPHNNVQDLDISVYDTTWQVKLETELQKEKMEDKVVVQLPKFKMEPPVKSLKQVLQDMGAVDMFDLADFSEISDEGLYVKDVLHQAVVEVNEVGSEAAGATAVIMQFRSMIMEELKYMIFNKPFLFLIEDVANNVPLFFGRVMDVSSLTNTPR